MEFAEFFSSAISTLGFPIVVCVVCFWYINKQEERHRSDIERMTTALDNNTKALDKILNKIGGE